MNGNQIIINAARKVSIAVYGYKTPKSITNRHKPAQTDTKHEVMYINPPYNGNK